MKNSKKLDTIKQKISALTKEQKQIEAKMVDSISKQVANIIIKKHATNIDISQFMKRVESLIDEMNSK